MSLASRQTFAREPEAFGMNFVVARNPDPDSRLPHLVRLPIVDVLILILAVGNG